jgi:signal transduction histidine kinase
MTDLIGNLVTIAKAEESENSEELSEVNVTETAQKEADTFASLASKDGKTLEREIEENVTMTANKGQLSQLMSLLLDNAIKYCDDGGTVKISLSQKGKGIKLNVSNSYAAGENQDYSRFFDRFYRDDKSHNIDKGGYGIGLSIADGIVKQYRGKIDVSWKDGVIDFSCHLKG